MRETKLETQFRDELLGIGLIAVLFLFTMIFLYWEFTKGSIGTWFAPVIIVNALLNAGMILYFNVLRRGRMQAQPSKIGAPCQRRSL
jgi:hypothetical protein